MEMHTNRGVARFFLKDLAYDYCAERNGGNITVRDGGDGGCVRLRCGTEWGRGTYDYGTERRSVGRTYDYGAEYNGDEGPRDYGAER